MVAKDCDVLAQIFLGQNEVEEEECQAKLTSLQDTEAQLKKTEDSVWRYKNAVQKTNDWLRQKLQQYKIETVYAICANGFPQKSA